MKHFQVGAVALSLLLSAPAFAQTNITLGAVNADPNAPVEITADNLSVDQGTGLAVFSGNVRIGQGEFRIGASEVRVVYNDTSGQVDRLTMTGGVTLATETEAAEAQSADYDLQSGILVLEGDVLVTQGASAISAQRMRINLNDGSAVMEGRVSTILNQGNN